VGTLFLISSVGPVEIDPTALLLPVTPHASVLTRAMPALIACSMRGASLLSTRQSSEVSPVQMP